MRLSRTAWNNVIIFSVMIIILLINTTNDRLFPEDNARNNEQLLPEHSVILTLAITFPDQSTIVFERVGRAWKMTSQGRILDLNNQQIEQVMFAWQQGNGLVQASNIVIEGQQGTQVGIGIAGLEQIQRFTLYPLADQLLIMNHQSQQWLAFPSALSRQLIPST